jgi:hypothetical protein
MDPMKNALGRSVLKAILAGATIAASLDLVDPIVFYGLRGVAPIKIPQSIASGILGRAAYSGGLGTALLGLALHLFIALFWAAIFVLAAQGVRALSRHAILSGMAYGVLIYTVMYSLVLPKSNVFPRPHFSHIVFINNVAAMVFLVGIPISLANAYFAHRLSDRKTG